MSYEPHLITPYTESGLSKYFKPFLIGDAAFEDMSNAYPWRGSVRKREGLTFLAKFPDNDKPVQGLKNWINPASFSEKLIGFSKTKAYKLEAGAFVDISFDPTPAPIVWSGGDDAYFWASNYYGAMWITNNVDTIRFWNGSDTVGWSDHKPIVSGAVTLDKALIILPYKGRLLVLNTVEGGISHPMRARWCQLGTPYLKTVAGTYVPPAPYAAPGSADDDAWKDDIIGRGGYLDADTNEQIVSAAIVKDTLIVFFQRSTWRLSYTANEQQPFIWERINTQYGSESTHSTISFDEVVLTFSRYGWIASDTNNVARIDQSIPDASFAIGAVKTTFVSEKRVHGIRDFFRQCACWTYENLTRGDFANQVYFYNYIDKSWAIFDYLGGTTATPTPRNLRTFGYYRTQSNTTWADLSSADDTWENYNEPGDVWNAPGETIDFPYVVTGDELGNVYTIFQAPDTSPDPNDQDVDVNYGFLISTKRFNPYIKQGLKCRIGYVDLYLTNIKDGEITLIDRVDDQDTQWPGLIKTVSTDLSKSIFVSGSAKYTRVYLNSSAHIHQFIISLSEAQRNDDLKGRAGFELQAMVLWTRPEGLIKG